MKYELAAALVCLERALEVLDASSIPGDVAAHVDMARSRIVELLAHETLLDQPSDGPGGSRPLVQLH
jgi:hypothetical protein